MKSMHSVCIMKIKLQKRLKFDIFRLDLSCNLLYALILLQVPGRKFVKGFNPTLDKNILWKSGKMPLIQTIRSHARELEVIKEEMKKLKTAVMQ